MNMAFRSWMSWVIYAMVLVIAPVVFDSDASLSLLSQMGTTAIFALAFNMLLGQGGMLSFGHAVYSGLGAFIVAHAINLARSGAIWMPVTLVPLAGGFAGGLFALLFGYLTTRKSGVTFSMITLGIAELVAAASLMFTGFFGGEAGISTNRVTGESFFGITYGPQIEVYYLIAFWLFLSTAAMYAFTRTPLGRIINAVRDNPERVEFLGYDARWARYLVLILSGFFAGISGGLSAINFEVVTAENLSAVRSGTILLFTFIGGVGYFAGPIIGAIVGIFLTVMLSVYSNAWQLYLGVFFIAIVMYAPGGIAGLCVQMWRITMQGGFSGMRAPLLYAGLTASAALLGVVMMIEMLYHLSLASHQGSTIMLVGLSVDTAAPQLWLVAGALLAGGAIGFRHARRMLAPIWKALDRDMENRDRQE